MTVTIHLDTSDDLSIVTSLLELLRNSETKIEFITSSKKKVVKDARPAGKSSIRISDKLHGSLSLPDNFDYKATLNDALLKKYEVNG